MQQRHNELAAPDTADHVRAVSQVELAAPPLAGLCDDCLIAVLAAAGPQSRPALRLVCRRFQELVDAALCPHLRVDEASHLAGGRLTGTPVYGSQLEFTAAATRALERRAAGLQCLELDFDAYGCVFAASLLHTAPLPALRRVALMNVEAQHVAALRALPALRHVLLGREINGPVTAGPAAELLVAQLAGLPLRSLSLSDYRLLPSLLISVADALPGLEELALGVEKVEQHGRLELAALPQLAALRSFELRLLGMRASAEGVTVGVLPGEAAAALRTLTSLLLAHVRPAAGEEEAFWAGLAALPALAQLRFEASVHAVRQPPAALLRLSTLTALHIQVLGEVHYEDPPNSTWTKLPELPEGALPSLASLHVSSVGLLALPASWCRLPLEELSLSGRSSWNAFYNLRLPDELATLAPTLRTLRLDNCGLRGLPEQVCKLTGLTSLRLRHNNVLLLPSLSSLKHLQELDICGNLTFKAAEALQGCGSLRRLLVRDVGPLASAGRRRSLDGGPVDGLEEAWLVSVRRELHWVPYVGHPAS